jgi:hypothetical protein
MGRRVQGESLDILKRQVGRKLRISKEGVAVLTEEHRADFTAITAQAPDLDAPHSVYPGLRLFTKDYVEEHSELGRLILDYRGLDPKYEGSEALPPPVYSLQRAGSDEPIETHPKFVTEWAGTGEAPIDGIFQAVTDDAGTVLGYKFIGFKTSSEFYGIRTYRAAGYIWRKSYVSRTQPDDSGISELDTPPGGAPTLPDDYSWLYDGLAWSKQGGIYSAEQVWIGAPWNTTVYTA